LRGEADSALAHRANVVYQAILILANLLQKIALPKCEQQPETHRFIESCARYHILQPQNIGFGLENRQHFRRVNQRFNYVIAAGLGVRSGWHVRGRGAAYHIETPSHNMTFRIAMYNAPIGSSDCAT
jgi:hypothetical protein